MLLRFSLLFSFTPVCTRLSTVGDRAFPVAAARIWNSLLQHVTSALSLPVFRSHLKTHLFTISHASWKVLVLLEFFSWIFQALESRLKLVWSWKVLQIKA